VAEMAPGVQLLQLVERAPLYLPITQSKQVSALPTENLPAAQLVHGLDWLVAVKVPDGHGAQA